mmetsp:Transcript_8303/g.20919  ORF Transcript_8303/g.20919 Transcript_8303/m.20919 type:complete len:710 (-) Transcript_8303:120-2249(-)
MAEKELTLSAQDVIRGNLKTYVNNPLYADVVLVFDNVRFVAHSTILCTRWSSIINPTQQASVHQKRKKKEQLVLDLKHDILSADSLPHILTYVYTGLVDFVDGLTVGQICELYQASTTYGFMRLLWKCECALTDSMKLEHVFQVLKFGQTHSLDAMVAGCLSFVKEHWDGFVKNKAECALLPFDLFHDIVLKLTTSEDCKVKVSEPLSEPPCTLFDDFKSLFNSMAMDDGLALLPKDLSTSHLNPPGEDETSSEAEDDAKRREKKERKEAACDGLKFHRLVLACNSSLKNTQTWWDETGVQQNPFCREFTPPTASITGRFAFSLQGMSTRAFRAFLHFAYNLTTAHMSVLDACELLPFCQQYGMGHLFQRCLAIASKKMDLDSAVFVLCLQHAVALRGLPEVEALTRNAADFIVANIGTVDLTTVFHVRHPHYVCATIILALQARARANPMDHSPKPMDHSPHADEPRHKGKGSSKGRSHTKKPHSKGGTEGGGSGDTLVPPDRLAKVVSAEAPTASQQEKAVEVRPRKRHSLELDVDAAKEYEGGRLPTSKSVERRIVSPRTHAETSGPLSPRRQTAQKGTLFTPKREAPNPATFDRRLYEIRKEGILFKKGAVRKNWKARWFILKDLKLTYFEQKKNAGYLTFKGDISLEKATIAMDDFKQHGLVLATPDRTFYLCSTDEEERASWFDAIGQSIQRQSSNAAAQALP